MRKRNYSGAGRQRARVKQGFRPIEPEDLATLIGHFSAGSGSWLTALGPGLTLTESFLSLRACATQERARRPTWFCLRSADSTDLRVRLQPGGWQSCLSLLQPHTHGNGISCRKSSCSASECFTVVPPSLGLVRSSEPLELKARFLPLQGLLCFHRRLLFTGNLCFFTVGFIFSLCYMRFYYHCILKLLVCCLNDFQMVAFGSSYWCFYALSLSGAS